MRQSFVQRLALLLLAAASAQAASSSAEISSKKNDRGGYTIKVTNRANHPITYVEFPHYLADQFTAPEGWETKCTYLSNIGVEKKPGICSATARSANDGIAPNQSAEFDMRLGRDGQNESVSGEQTARLKFADGAVAEIPGVYLPTAPARWSNLPLITGFGGIVVLFILLGRRKKAAPAT